MYCSCHGDTRVLVLGTWVRGFAEGILSLSDSHCATHTFSKDCGPHVYRYGGGVPLRCIPHPVVYEPIVFTGPTRIV